jgi:hypothetical protein
MALKESTKPKSNEFDLSVQREPLTPSGALLDFVPKA